MYVIFTHKKISRHRQNNSSVCPRKGSQYWPQMFAKITDENYIKNCPKTASLSRNSNKEKEQKKTKNIKIGNCKAFSITCKHNNLKSAITITNKRLHVDSVFAFFKQLTES